MSAPPVELLIALHLPLVARTARHRKLTLGSAEYDEAVSAGTEELWQACEYIAAGGEIWKTNEHYIVMRINRAMADAMRVWHRKRTGKREHYPIHVYAHSGDMSDEGLRSRLAVSSTFHLEVDGHEHMLGGLAADSIVARLVEVDERMPRIVTMLYQGHQQKEIATELGISPARMSFLIHKARQYLGGSVDAALAGAPPVPLRPRPTYPKRSLVSQD